MLHCYISWVFIVVLSIFYDGGYPLTRWDLNGISSPSYSRDQILHSYVTESTRKRQMIDIGTFPYRFTLLLFCSKSDCVRVFWSNLKSLHSQPSRRSTDLWRHFRSLSLFLPLFPVFPPFKIRRRLRAATRPTFVHGVLRFCSFVRSYYSRHAIPAQRRRESALQGSVIDKLTRHIFMGLRMPRKNPRRKVH